ncbi:hypothetical protein ASE00_00745 [Sphingomonas sp. Root710]|uniref:VOC family protein n=1 Tax=Sphingomonas sp. Root710 TaxID=1736594 RepID=UPI0006FD95A1|nr:VOC family protein [Sphingomonas sp. Root710]KRB85368.1 hypothetical protein ASE00_00745 [Sphingomonas sp. Root710]
MTAPFRYKRLGYLVLDVSDIERSTRFATDVFGLDLVSEAGDGSRYFRGSFHHHDVIFRPASKPMAQRSAWELENRAELDKAFAYFTRIGFAPAWLAESETRQLEIERAFRVVDPVIGLTWEYFIDMTVMPSSRRNGVTGFQGGKHFGLCVDDGRSASRLLIDDMGFLLSDYFEGDVVTLLRAFPNPNHHSLALLGGTEGPVRFHHVAFMVNEIDDIGRLFNRAKQMDVDIHFGIGRHPTSGSIHLYIYDHDNFVWEYTLGMEQFPEAGAREARRMSSAPEDFDLWGAVPDNSRKYELPEVFTRLSKPLEAVSTTA